MKYKSEPLLRDDFSATFTTALMQKDVDLVLDLAERELASSCRSTALLRTLLEATAENGHADEDFMALYLQLQDRGTSGSDHERGDPGDGDTIASRGATMAVDWEQRIDFAKLRADRLARAQAGCWTPPSSGALLLFDPNNIRYVTSTHIGEWARDKNARWVLLPRGEEPILWDFGSAARHHQLYAPWLPAENFRAGVRADARRDAGRDGRARPAGREDRVRAARARPAGRARRHRHGRPGHDRGARSARACTSPTARA